MTGRDEIVSYPDDLPRTAFDVRPDRPGGAGAYEVEIPHPV